MTRWKFQEIFNKSWATIAKISEFQPGLGLAQTDSNQNHVLIHQTENRIPVGPSIFIIRKVIKWFTWFIEQTQYQKEINEIEYF